MILSAFILRWSSLPARSSMMQVPADTNPPAILALHDRYLAAWEGRTGEDTPEDNGPELAIA